MAKRVSRIATYEDLFDLPDNVVGEIFSGDLVTHPRPSPRHSRAASMVGVLLGGSFDFKTIGDENGWWILDEPECHLGADIRLTNPVYSVNSCIQLSQSVSL